MLWAEEILGNLLDFAVKFVEVSYLLNPVKVEICILQNGVLVGIDEFLHVAFLGVRYLASETN